ncbi:hypothetical protein P1P75_05870 [Streptomyces sp. ID05-39B]|uniref:hypothetical protein n=1 Tax=Streptomyces sp. ID05-39B TaxID=3028664 RepID=UPI0029B7C78D|nr:hypothetical protein [Streptomyces sp. ID05-39B]MDX3525973.1 hypothetical protein [Streptomyces sp. ID05-39B]
MPNDDALPVMPSDSWRWISYSDPAWSEVDAYKYSGDPSDFAQACVRRAVDEVRRALGISTIEAAVMVEGEAKTVLTDVVAESRCQPRKMTWAEIGAKLGGAARQTVQKRFGRGISPQRVGHLRRQLVQFREAYLDEGRAENQPQARDRRLIAEAIHGLALSRSYGVSAYLDPQAGGYDLPPAHTQTVQQAQQNPRPEVTFVVTRDRWAEMKSPSAIQDQALRVEGDRLVPLEPNRDTAED